MKTDCKNYFGVVDRRRFNPVQIFEKRILEIAEMLKGGP